MVARISFIKTALVFSGSLTMSLVMTALPSVAQAQMSAVGLEATEPLTEKSIEVVAEVETASELPDLALPQNAESETAIPETSLSEVSALQTDALALPAPDMPVLAAEASAVAESEITSAESAIPLEGFAIATIPLSESTDSDENSEIAMAELVEALNADMPEIQAMVKTAEDIAAQTPESDATVAIAKPSQGIAPPQPGASVLDTLNSIGLGNSANISLADDAFSDIEADAVPALKAALESDNTLTQLYAADALWTLTRDSDLVLPALISAATSGNSLETRELANIGLSYLGRQAIPAIPFLNRMLGDRDSNVRSLVQDTLAIVTSNNRPATTLGILAREAAERPGLIPTALNVITRLWR